MMTESFSYAIRPLTEQDIPEIQALFRSTVLHVNSKDYTKEEVEDWASCGNNITHWKELFTKHNFIAALDRRGNIIGFSSINSNGYLHSMFVHKDWQRKRVATLLLLEMEELVHEYGVHNINAEVSISARPFFERRGYRVIKEQQVKANQLCLTNYIMTKTL